MRYDVLASMFAINLRRQYLFGSRRRQSAHIFRVGNQRRLTSAATSSLTATFLTFALSTFAAPASSPCRIEVVEKGTGWPVPLVELRTTHNVRFVTDNAGVIAFDLPELMGRETWLEVFGHGYEVS